MTRRWGFSVSIVWLAVGLVVALWPFAQAAGAVIFPLQSEAAHAWAAPRMSKHVRDLETFTWQFDKTGPYRTREPRKRLEKVNAGRVAKRGPAKPRRSAFRLPFEPEMVRIPGGTFLMGCVSGKGCSADEKPAHLVTVSGFEIGKYEVTVGQFRAFVEDTGHDMGRCHRPRGGTWRDPGFKQNDDHPVVCVSWEDAVAYGKWLSRKTGKKYRLPTEAEWEYAARGDAMGQNRTQYHFGNGGAALGLYGWYGRNSDGKTDPVNGKRANKFGLHYMHGNVWEWVHDWYGGYAEGHQVNPRGPKKGQNRVVRGGGWRNHARSLRSANRHGLRPGFRNLYLGFRLARTYD